MLFLFARSAVAAETYCAKTKIPGYACFPTLAEAEAKLRHESPYIHGNWIDVDPELVERYDTHVAVRSGLVEKTFLYQIPDGKPLFDDGITFAWCPPGGGCVRGFASESDAYAAAVAAHPAYYDTWNVASDEALAGSGTASSHDPELLANSRRERLHVNLRRKVWEGENENGSRRTSFIVWQQHDYRCPDYQSHDWGAPLARACHRTSNDIIISRNGTIKSCGMDCSVGNPVHPLTGVKSLTENDLIWEGLDLGRIYSSSEDAPVDGHLGPSWSSSWDYTLLEKALGHWVLFSNGAVEAFRPKGATTAYSTGEPGTLLERQVGLVLIRFADGRVGRFQKSFNGTGSGGYLLESLEDPAVGRVLTFERCPQAQTNCTDPTLSSIKSDSGRSLDFAYTGSGSERRLTSISSSGVDLIHYGYDAARRLKSAQRIGEAEPLRNYYYDQPEFICVDAQGASLSPCHVSRKANLLTSVKDQKGAIEAVYRYDNVGRAVSTEGAGGTNRFSVSYQGSGSSTVISPLGAVTNYSSKVSGFYNRLTGETTGALSTGASYNSLGFLVRRTDERGSASDFYPDGFGRLQTQVSASGTPEQQIRSFEWQNVYNRPSAIVSSGVRRTLQYNERGQTVEVATTDRLSDEVRLQTLTYCEQAAVDAGECPTLGRLMRVDGPRSDVEDVVTFQYYMQDSPECQPGSSACAYRKGDLKAKINALGHKVEVLAYDPLGRPLSVRDANGITTDTEYHPRGWLTARKVRGAVDGSESDDRITRIEYEPSGLVKKTTLPDGSYTSFTYDAAHRLIGVGDGEGNRIHYLLDNAGNKVKEDTIGHSGTVMRTLSRIYNQLGQLQTLADACPITECIQVHEETHIRDARRLNPSICSEPEVSPPFPAPDQAVALPGGVKKCAHGAVFRLRHQGGPQTHE
ncbi:MAG: DUF6531 domain-containing protein, partial [Pseudomonadota bacterium]|nr:DUF6531 domain-containing protein [Pseudomonadota bacterium]